MRIIGGLALMGACLAAASHASAYTLKVSNGQPVRWHRSSVELQVSPRAQGLLQGIELADATAAALGAWKTTGALPSAWVAPSDSAGWGYDPSSTDNHNTVEVVPDWPFDAELAAVTVASIDAATGEILDADILLNAQTHSFTDVLRQGVPEGAFDLTSVLTHELGHFFGLDESYDHEEATMWPYIRQGETQARTLADDDVQGIVASYGQPLASTDVEVPVPTRKSSSTRATGCSAGPASAASSVWLWLLAALLCRHAQRTRSARTLLLVATLSGCAVSDNAGEQERASTPKSNASTRANARQAAAPREAQGWLRGRVQDRSTHRVGKLLRTRLRIADEYGNQVTAEVWGGEFSGVVQHVFGYVVPELGDEVLADVRANRFKGWRLSDDGPIAGQVIDHHMFEE